MKMYFPKKRSEKIQGEHYTYKASRSQNRFSFNASMALVPVNHKGKHILAFVDKWKKTYRTCETISYSDALRLMSFLASYINTVKPTEETLLLASTKAHCKGIVRDQDKMLANIYKLPESGTGGE